MTQKKKLESGRHTGESWLEGLSISYLKGNVKTPRIFVYSRKNDEISMSSKTTNTIISHTGLDREQVI